MQVVVFCIGGGVFDIDDIGDGILNFALIEEATDTLIVYIGIDADIAVEITTCAGDNRRSKLGVVDRAEAFFRKVDDRSLSLGYTVRNIDDGDLTIADIAGLVGDSGDVLLVAYVKGSECCTVTRATESFCGQNFIGNLAGSVELGNLAVFLYHPEAAVGVG